MKHYNKGLSIVCVVISFFMLFFTNVMGDKCKVGQRVKRKSECELYYNSRIGLYMCPGCNKRFCSADGFISHEDEAEWKNYNKKFLKLCKLKDGKALKAVFKEKFYDKEADAFFCPKCDAKRKTVENLHKHNMCKRCSIKLVGAVLGIKIDTEEE